MRLRAGSLRGSTIIADAAAFDQVERIVIRAGYPLRAGARRVGARRPPQHFQPTHLARRRHRPGGLPVVRRGDLADGLQALRGGLEQAGDARFLPRFLLLLGELAVCLGKAGEVVRGLATVEETLARCEARDERWYVAELLRIKGELATLEDAPDAAAGRHFLQALDCARPQGAVSWELRAAVGLARLWRDQHRAAEAREILRSVYGRFTEGFDTADLREARSLLEELE